MKTQENLHFSLHFWKKIRKLQIRPSVVEWPQTSATIAVAVGPKSSATAVELRPSVQH